MEKKGLCAPSYYKQFKCINSNCRHSCCIGWEIDVDENTLKKYYSLEGNIGEEIRKSISDGGAPHFILSGERCPHLNERGLCKIICELGEEYLCDICRLHPRFFNETKRGLEVGLGASCEVAARIILSSDGYSSWVKLGDEPCGDVEFDVYPLRERVYSILRDSDAPYAERLGKIQREFNISPSILSDGDWREALSSLEYLKEENRELFTCYSSEVMQTKLDIFFERSLAYFVFRHASNAESEEEFRTGLGFALFCERLFASIARSTEASSIEDCGELLRIISEEIEYSTDNTDALRAEIEFAL